MNYEQLKCICKEERFIIILLQNVLIVNVYFPVKVDESYKTSVLDICYLT